MAHSRETREKISKARREFEAKKVTRCGLYTSKHFPEAIRDICQEVDNVVDELIVSELGGVQSLRPSQWILLTSLRTSLIITQACVRKAAAAGIVRGEAGDPKLVDVLTRCGPWFDRVEKSMRALGLVRQDGQIELSIADRLRVIEGKAQ